MDFKVCNHPSSNSNMEQLELPNQQLVTFQLLIFAKMKHGKGTYACGRLALRASCVTCKIKAQHKIHVVEMEEAQDIKKFTCTWIACWGLQGSRTMGLGAIDDINENLDNL